MISAKSNKYLFTFNCLKIKRFSKVFDYSDYHCFLRIMVTDKSMLVSRMVSLIVIYVKAVDKTSDCFIVFDFTLFYHIKNVYALCVYAVSYTHLDVYKRQRFFFMLTLKAKSSSIRLGSCCTCLLYTSRCV